VGRDGLQGDDDVDADQRVLSMVSLRLGRVAALPLTVISTDRSRRKNACTDAEGAQRMPGQLCM
jgi:hypothetical protein